MLLVNFQSIRSKKSDLLALINTHKPDVIAGTETWLTSDVINSDLNSSTISTVRVDQMDMEE